MALARKFHSRSKFSISLEISNFFDLWALWETVPAVPVPLSVSGKMVPTVPVPGSGSVPP